MCTCDISVVKRAVSALLLRPRAPANVAHPHHRAYPQVPKSWPAIEAGLVASIPFDSELNIHLEYDGYNTSGGQSSIIKQADVILLGFPLMVNMTPAVRETDLVYYRCTFARSFARASVSPPRPALYCRSLSD